jgi:two-component system OmpR family sensor kinase
MPALSGLRRFGESISRLPERTSLRVKLVSALLALVAIALAVISVSSLAVFRSYLQDRADAQLQSLIAQAGNTSRVGGLRGPAFSLSGYVVELQDANGNLVPGYGSWQDLTVPGPKIPADRAWLTANAGKLTNVPAVSGNDNWRVIIRQVSYQELVNPFTGQFGPRQAGTVIAGVDLGNIDQTIGWLARMDLLVGLLIMAALATAGVAAVRASLRPLTDIEHTAEAIAAGDLSQRVPDRDPRTEVGRLGRSLNAMLAQIETAFHARAESEAAARRSEERMRQFVADASHELRTPLTAIRGFAEYYRQLGGVANGAALGPGSHAATPGRATPGGGATPGGPAAADQQARTLAAGGQLSKPDMDRIMQRVEQESARMGLLLEDMLLLARLDQQRPIEHRPVDLLTLITDAVQDVRMIAPGRKIELTVAPGTAFLVLGDEARLRQVISNLMNNALTHTPDGTPVDVRILASSTDGGLQVPSVVLEVADRGPGLSAEQAERVFERFYRADQARGRKTGGAGLGLAIVAALVAAHGGTVGVEKTPGGGATFQITLPLAAEAT